MAYEFTKDLETGNALIDSQHRELIAAVNGLLDACGHGKGRAHLAESAKFLSDYTAKHFTDEERLQVQSKYPDYVNHKRYHDMFKKTVADLTRRLNAEGPSVVLVGEMNTALVGWLINHIKREDVKVAAHIRAQ